MKFSCYKNDLNEALAFVIRAVAVKPTTPILAGISRELSRAFPLILK